MNNYRMTSDRLYEISRINMAISELLQTDTREELAMSATGREGLGHLFNLLAKELMEVCHQLEDDMEGGRQ